MANQREKLLIFWFYDNYFENKFTENIGLRDNKAKALLEKYDAEADTGMPVDKEKCISFIAFIPGYDAIIPVINFVQYGQVPTFGEYFLQLLTCCK